MEKAKGLAKGGWHPKGKDGGTESWRGEHKGINQVAGWVGKGKSTPRPAEDHVSRPLAALKDPDSFGPPPKNVNYHGGAAVPNAITPDRNGLGVPLSTQEIRAKEEADRREARATEEAVRKPAPPPVPYRVNTSGLSTNNLPKPPVRRIGHDDQSPASEARPSTKPKPSLPPRLPPRQGSMPLRSSTSPPPPYTLTPDAVTKQESGINQVAVNRLGSAGISAPGLGIGSSPSYAHQNTRVTPSSTEDQPSANGPQLSELQARFSKISTKSRDTDPPSQGTSLADKQAALRTAQSFRNDPSSVSLADARSSAVTANNFRERHGEQVNAGWKSANAMNKKYDIANRANSFASNSGAPSSNEVQPSPSPIFSPTTLTSSFHKRAPPPPPQKPGSSGGSTTSPPPVPLSSKPR